MIRLTWTNASGTHTEDASDDADLKELTDAILGQDSATTFVHIKITQGSPAYRMFAPLADLWLSANPAFRLGMPILGAMMIATAIFLHMN